MDSTIIQKHWNIIAEVLIEQKVRFNFISLDGDARVRSAFTT